MKTIQPPRLNPGDTVGLIGISNHIYDRQERFDKSIKIFEQEFGVKIKLGAHALGHYHYSSGTAQERLADFHTMIADPNIKAIQFTVGGETAIDLVDKLDYDLIKNNPKIISGFSDCTTLLNPIFAKTGLVTYHGFEFSFLGYDGQARYMLNSIRQAWFGNGTGTIKPNPAWRDWRGTFNRYNGWQTIRSGRASGHLIGGNLISFYQLLDTSYCPDLHNSILLLESYKQEKKEVHRQLSALRLHRVFDQISGLIVGYNVGLDQQSDTDPEWGIKEILLEITSGYNFPILQIGELGHYVENTIIPIGGNAAIDATDLSFNINANPT